MGKKLNNSKSPLKRTEKPSLPSIDFKEIKAELPKTVIVSQK